MNNEQAKNEALIGGSVSNAGLGDDTFNVSAIRGWERIGSVGDLRIRYLVALGQGERTRVWVVGCFDNPRHPLDPPDAGSNRSELFALAWQLARSDVRAIWERAKVFHRDLYHRM